MASRYHRPIPWTLDIVPDVVPGISHGQMFSSWLLRTTTTITASLRMYVYPTANLEGTLPSVVCLPLLC